MYLLILTSNPFPSAISSCLFGFHDWLWEIALSMMYRSRYLLCIFSFLKTAPTPHSPTPGDSPMALLVMVLGGRSEIKFFR